MVILRHNLALICAVEGCSKKSLIVLILACFRVRRPKDLHLGLGEEEEGVLFQVRTCSKRFPVKVFALFG